LIDKLFDPEQFPFTDVECLGIAICKTGPDQLHMGFLYRIDDEDPVFCDLAWHFQLRHAPPEVQQARTQSKFYWSNFSIDEVNCKVIAAGLEELRENSQSNVIPYGIDIDPPCFTADGVYVVQPTGKGLTCATFIVEICRTYNVVLIDEDSWPRRDDDKVWQESIIRVLAENLDNAENHVEAMQKDIGCARFRPEEVTACTMLEDHPIDYPDSVELAREIKEVVLAG